MQKMCLHLCFPSPHLIIFFFFFSLLRWRPAVCQSCPLFTSQCLDNKLRFSPLLPADLPRRMKGPSRFFSRSCGVGTLSRRHFCHHYRSAGRHRSGPMGGECGGSGRDVFFFYCFLSHDRSVRGGVLIETKTCCLNRPPEHGPDKSNANSCSWFTRKKNNILRKEIILRQLRGRITTKFLGWFFFSF